MSPAIGFEATPSMTSTPNTAVASPSWRIAIGLIAATAGYLCCLVGVALFAWSEIHAVYRVPIVVVPVAGLALAVAGGVLIQRERADS